MDLQNTIIITGIILGIFLGLAVILYILTIIIKKRKYNFVGLVYSVPLNTYYLVNFGNVKEKWFLFYNYGKEERLKTRDGRIILGDLKGNFFFENKKIYNLLERRQEDDFLVIINEVSLNEEERKVLYSIRSSELKNQANESLNNLIEEERPAFERVIPYIVLGIVAMVFLASLVFTINFITSNLEKMQGLVKESYILQAETLKNITNTLTAIEVRG